MFQKYLWAEEWTAGVLATPRAEVVWTTPQIQVPWSSSTTPQNDNSAAFIFTADYRGTRPINTTTTPLETTPGIGSVIVDTSKEDTHQLASSAWMGVVTTGVSPPAIGAITSHNSDAVVGQLWASVTTPFSFASEETPETKNPLDLITQDQVNMFSSKGQEILSNMFTGCFQLPGLIYISVQSALDDTNINTPWAVVSAMESLKDQNAWKITTGFNQESWDQVAPYLAYIGQTADSVLSERTSYIEDVKAYVPEVATPEDTIREHLATGSAQVDFSRALWIARDIRTKANSMTAEQLAYILSPHMNKVLSAYSDELTDHWVDQVALRGTRDAVRFTTGISDFDTIKEIVELWKDLSGYDQGKKIYQGLNDVLFFYQNPEWLEQEASKIKAEIENKKSSESDRIKTFHGALDDKKNLLKTKESEKIELESAFDKNDLRFVSQFFYDFKLILQSNPDFSEAMGHAITNDARECLRRYPDIARVGSEIKKLTFEIDTDEKSLKDSIDQDTIILSLRAEIKSLEKNLENLEGIKHSLTQRNQEQTAQ